MTSKEEALAQFMRDAADDLLKAEHALQGYAAHQLMADCWRSLALVPHRVHEADTLYYNAHWKELGGTMHGFTFGIVGHKLHPKVPPDVAGPPLDVLPRRYEMHS